MGMGETVCSNCFVKSFNKFRLLPEAMAPGFDAMSVKTKPKTVFELTLITSVSLYTP